MGKRKRLIVIIVAILLAFGVGFGAYRLLNKDSSKKSTFDDRPVVNVAPQTKEEVTAVIADIAKFEVILTAYNNKDYATVIGQAKAYAEYTQNSMTQRINAYYLCTRSAYELKKLDVVEDCAKKAQDLANTLDADQAAGWKQTIDAGKQGKSVEETPGAAGDQ